jgi:hypothetical protein
MMNVLRGTVVGTLVLIVTCSLLLIPLFLLIGPERALVGNTLEFNTFWVGLAMVVSLSAASVAGWISHRVAGSMLAVYAIMALVMVFGLTDAAVHHWLQPGLSLSRDALPWQLALLHLREPLWYDLTSPFLIAGFIWVAGSSRQQEVSG